MRCEYQEEGTLITTWDDGGYKMISPTDTLARVPILNFDPKILNFTRIAQHKHPPVYLYVPLS